MSAGDNTKERASVIPLRDVFQKSLTASDGNSGLAFIAALDELDRRMSRLPQLISVNTTALAAFSDWVTQSNGTMTELPLALRESLRAGLKQDLPEIAQRIETAATKGARSGAETSQEEIAALRYAKDAYEARYHTLTRLAVVGIPTIFIAAMITGLMFTHAVLPALPSSWQWPCTITGLEFRTSNDINSETTYCVIER